jgi:tRNA U34 5-methylaminomethyl-2-thiouridine-forming methyltransferase MnmC
MKHNNLHPLVKEYYDLEQFGEALFDTTPAAPKLSKSSKRMMLKTITKSQNNFSIFKTGFGFAATAFAAFAIMFGFAQTSRPGDTLYRLHVGSTDAVLAPTIQQTETVKAELAQQQTTVETLKKTGAPVAEVKKAEKTLNKTIESGKKLGINVTKVLEDAKKAHENSETNKDTESESSKSGNTSPTSSSSNSTSGSNIR